jgi:hypothetical protein
MDYAQSMLVRQAMARAKELIVERQIISIQQQIETSMYEEKEAVIEENKALARDHTNRLKTQLKLASEARDLARDQSRLLNRVDLNKTLQSTKELPGFEMRTGTPMAPQVQLDVEMKRRVMNLSRAELIHVLQLCNVTNIKSDDPLNRLNHQQLCDLVASSAVNTHSYAHTRVICSKKLFGTADDRSH